MKKAFILFSLLLLVSCISGPGLFAKNYYLSNTGNDAVVVPSKTTPWKTISKLNATSIVAGDSIFFQAGGVWRETLTVRQGASGTGNRVYYGRYDIGNNPKILGSNQALTWTAEGHTNIWKAATTLDNPEDGDWGYPGCIYFENGATTTWGISKTYSSTFANLTAEYNWCWNANILYCYSTSDPDTRYTSIEAAQRDACMSFSNSASSYITVSGIDLHYARRAGYCNNNYPEAPGQTDVTFSNCNIGYIGVKEGQYAYGIEAFHSNFLVENCTITDCGRRGISFNLYENPSVRGVITINNVVIRNNTFKRGQHTTSLDFATADSETGDVLTNIYYYNNIVDDHEIAMAADDGSGSNQVYFQPYSASYDNVYIYNNVFIHATFRNILITGGLGAHYYVWNNTLFAHNHNIKANVWGNLSIVSECTVDVRNNIISEDLPYSSSIDTWNVISDSKTETNVSWAKLDYNLYYHPVTNHGSERGFMAGDLGYYTTAQWATFKTDHPTFESHSPTPADPLFTSTAAYDMTLASGSPAIGKGTPIAMVTTDILGNLRSTTAPSLGAYEYITSAVPTYSSSVVTNATPSILDMTYNLSLANIVPASSAFTVMVNSVARTVSTVTISGTKVSLTLASPIVYGDIITVAYTKPATNPIQTSSGEQAVSITAQSVTNSVASASIPAYQSSVVANVTPSVLDMTFSLSLANIVPATSAFSVTVNSIARSINSVTISGTNVSLTLSTPVVYGDVVTVSYTKPGSNPIQTPSGGQASSFTAQIVTNSVAQIPAYQSSTVTNQTPSVLEMTFSSSLANIIPATSSFTVMVNSVARSISTVAISGTKVSLTLASPVVFGDIITVAYTKPATNPIQTPLGGKALDIAVQAVINLVAQIPVYQSSLVSNATPYILEITYNLTFANIIPATSSYTVMVNSVARSISTVAISGTKVFLTLSSPIVYGEILTVAYTKPATNPLQTPSGGQAVSIPAQSVTNSVGSVAVAVYQNSIVTDASPSILEMTYSSNLANIVPVASAFTVMVNSASRSVSTVAISGTKVSLTLASPIAYGDIITVAYTKPATNPLQTPAGGQSMDLTTQPVTNSVIQSLIPVYQNSVVTNATPSVIEMTYNSTLANIVPATSAFTVRVNSVPRTINSVAVVDTKILLTLAIPIVYGEIITVAYTKPATNPVQALLGGQAVSITAQSVTNSVGSSTIPVYQNSIVKNAAPTVLEITYSSSLANIIPATSAFSVIVNSVPITVSNIEISGALVSLTLATPIVFGDIITISYTKPGTNPIQIVSAGEAASFTARPVINSVLQVPVYLSSYIAKATPSIVEITYSLSLANIVPDVTVFTVQVNSLSRSVKSVLISDTKVSLVMASMVEYGDVVTISYNKPSTNPIQAKSGGLANSFDHLQVSNNAESNNPTFIDITIYPNPANESFNIALGGEPPSEPVLVRIISLSGVLVYETTIEPGVAIRNIPVSISSGFYTVHLMLRNKIISVGKLTIMR
jgi:uncharacterized repeat protein (TIGR02059 family)